MGLGAQAHRLLRDAAGGSDEGGGRAMETLRFAAGAARLMERCRAAALALERFGFPSGPEDTAPDDPNGGDPMHDRLINGYPWKVIAARDAERRRVLFWLAQGNKLTDLPSVEDWPDSHDPDMPDIEKLDERFHPPAPRSACNREVHTLEATVPNRGKLKNGNPSGDYLAAPRCGAKSRAGHACRQPAMANGRCRFHGGMSTGPRTAEGRHRAQTARLTHGFCRAEIIRLRGAAARAGRNLERLTAAAKEAFTTKSQRPRRKRASDMYPAMDRNSFALRAAADRTRVHLRRQSTLAAISTGRFVPFVTLWCNPLSPVSAGHGVHRSNFIHALSPAGQRHAQRQRLRG
jgi:hypothetical protein